MNITLKQIEKVLASFDPECFISDGADDTEYNGEAKVIYDKMITKQPKYMKDILALVTFTFYEHCGCSVDFDNNLYINSIYLNNKYRLEALKAISKVIFELNK